MKTINKNVGSPVQSDLLNDKSSKENNGVCEYKSIGCKHNNCIISSNEKAIIKKLVDNKDLDIIRKDMRKLGEFKLFVVENINGKDKCSDFLDNLWKETGHNKATFDERQWTSCAMIHLLHYQGKPLPKDVPHLVWGC